MKSITRSLVFSFCFLMFSQLFTNCTKTPTTEPNHLDTNTIAEGIVLEYGTLKPIPNAKVILRECESEFLGGSYCFEIDSFFTGADGLYSFDFEHKNFGSGAIIDDATYRYELRVEADNYFLNRSSQLYLKKEHVNQDTAVMDPHAWIKFHIKNVNPFDQRDDLDLGVEFQGSGLIPEIKGKDVDIEIPIHVYGNRTIKFYWVFEKNGERSDLIRDSLYVPAFDTLKYEILF